MNKKELTEKQKVIYDLYFIERLSVVMIKYRLGISHPTISKQIKAIRKKLGIFGVNFPQETKGGYTTTIGYQKKLIGSNTFINPQNWRIHGLNFVIKPYYYHKKYYQILEKVGNFGIRFSQFTVMLYKDRVRIQSGKGISWQDPDKFKAILKAEDSFNNFLTYVSRYLGFDYDKEGRIAIKLVSSELALENSDFSKAYQDQTGQSKLFVYGEDGKVYFKIDKSNVLEHEYIGKDSFMNSERLEPYLNDMLYNQPLTNSQLTSRLGDTVTAIEKIVKAIAILGGRL